MSAWLYTTCLFFIFTRILNYNVFFFHVASYKDDKPNSHIQDDHVIWDRHYTLKVRITTKLDGLLIIKLLPVSLTS